MLDLLLKKRKSFIQYLVACCFFVILDVIQAFVIAMIFQAVEVGTIPYFNQTVLISVLYMLVSSGLFILSRLLRIAFMRDVLHEVRVRAFEKILSMSQREFNQKSRDVYFSNLTNDINTFENTFFISLLNFLIRCGSFIAIMTVLMIVNWRVGLIILVISGFVLLISRFFYRRTLNLQQEKSTENERFMVNVSNTFRGLEIIKLNNIEREFYNRSKKQIQSLEQTKAKFSFFTGIQNYTNEALGTIVLMGLIVYLMYNPTQPLGYGTIALVVQLSALAVFPLMQIFPFFNVLKSSEDIYKKITRHETSEELTNHRNRDFHFHTQIRLQNIKFFYDEKQVFKHLDFVIEKGKKYLLRGPSGSGKTTLLKLLSQAYDDFEGDILIDDVDLKSIRYESFNAAVGFIYQDVFLFEATLNENVTLFKPYEPAWIESVIQRSGLTDFLEKHNHQLDTMIVDNGKNLSGGERQRVSIARALCKNAELLLIDEATASLNEDLGRAIEETIIDLDATVVAISHRYYPGISEKYDYVLELKDGYINSYRAAEYFQGVNE
ncbi:MAG: ABC transporter ATP-binding protein [Candidatus Izemoplasmatales bacterium]|nr:ABC transporter ATP-binding protein [Candidatus Izemoplasmatales bacterium]